MGTIHFVSGLESLTLKALKDAEDCADILKDLGRIKYTIAHGSEQEARALDYELQQKYPAIDAMLQAADNLSGTGAGTEVVKERAAGHSRQRL